MFMEVDADWGTGQWFGKPTLLRKLNLVQDLIVFSEPKCGSRTQVLSGNPTLVREPCSGSGTRLWIGKWIVVRKPDFFREFDCGSGI